MNVDVIIAGGGIIGSACAYFLRAHPDFAGSIAVIEPDPAYGTAASSRSASSIRQQFSTPVNIALSAFGMEFLRGFGQDVGLVEASYLYLATQAGASALERRAALQRSAHVAVTLHDSAALGVRYPWLNVADLAAGTDTQSGEGWFDGYALLTALRTANERSGIQYVRDRVVGFEQASAGRIDAALLAGHGRVGCRYAVNAAGTRARALCKTVGVDLPVQARKRSVFVFSCPSALPACPLVIDPSGLWFRPERSRFLCGIPADPDPEVDVDDFEVDLAAFERVAWPVLAHRVPAFEAVRLASAWAGHYDYNVFDQNAFVGPVPGIANLLLANGFSGHGLQHAAGIGRGIAEWICHGRYDALDLQALAYDRYPANLPLREVNVI